MLNRKIILAISLLLITIGGQSTNVDSLKNVLQQSKNKNAVVARLNYQIAHSFYQDKIYDSAAIYANSAVNAYRNMAKPHQLQTALELYSNILKILAFNNKLVPVQQELIQVCEHNKDSLKLMQAYDKMGLIYYHTNVTDSAIYYYQKSYEIGKLLKNNDALINSYNNISQVYSYFGNHEKELEYCKKGLAVAISSSSLVKQGTFYHNAALAYISLGQLDSALVYAEKAIAINKKIGDTDRIGLNKTALGNIYCMKGDIPKGMVYFNEVLAYDTKIGNLHGETEGNYNLGFSYYYLGNYELALKYSFESLRFAHKAQLKQYQVDNYELISNIYRKQKNYEKALKYFDKYFHLKDSLKKNTNLQLISSIQSEYEYEKNIHKIELLSKENEIKEKQITYTITTAIITSLSLIILGIILFFLYKKYKRNEELNNKLLEQYQVVQESNTRLETFEKNTQKDLEYAYSLQASIIDNISLFKVFFQNVCFTNYTINPVKNAFLWSDKLGNKLVWVIMSINQQNVRGAFTSIYLFNKLSKVFYENKYSKIDHFAKLFFNEAFDKNNKAELIKDVGFCFCAMDIKKADLEFINHGIHVELIRNAKVWDFKSNIQKTSNEKISIPITHRIQLHQNDNLVFFHQNWNYKNTEPNKLITPGKAIFNKDALIPSKTDYSDYINELKTQDMVKEFILLSLIYGK